MTEEMKNVTPETAEAPEHVETMEDYKEELEASFKQIHEGDILTGTVIGVSESAITLDLKYYTDGIIRLEDFTNDPNFNLAEDIHVGDEISATVIRRDDGEGHILLSAKEANEVLAWDKLRKYKEEGTNLKVKIAGIVKSFTSASSVTVSTIISFSPSSSPVKSPSKLARIPGMARKQTS